MATRKTSRTTRNKPRPPRLDKRGRVIPAGFLRGRPKTYGTLYERIVANTRLQEEDNPNSCWLWKGAVNPYPNMAVRENGKLRNLRPHRAMLEIVTGFLFPFDEAGHLCDNHLCCNPDHLEIQTSAHNKWTRKYVAGIWKNLQASWVPTLFPNEDELQLAANEAFDFTVAPRTHWQMPMSHPTPECPF